MKEYLIYQVDAAGEVKGLITIFADEYVVSSNYGYFLGIADGLKTTIAGLNLEETGFKVVNKRSQMEKLAEEKK